MKGSDCKIRINYFDHEITANPNHYKSQSVNPNHCDQHKVTRILTIDDSPDGKKRWRSQFPWATNAVDREDLACFDSLTFGYYVDIIHIAFKEIEDSQHVILPLDQRQHVILGLEPSISRRLPPNSRALIERFMSDHWSKGVVLSSHFEFEWVISGAVLDQMQKCHFGQHFYSSNFDGNNWCLYVSPAGWTPQNKDLFSFQLKLLQKPYCLAAVYASYKLETEAFGGIDIDGSKVFHFQKCRSGWSFDENRIEFKQFLKMDRLVIRATIDILAGYDVKTRRRIEERDWEKYGIIKRDK